MMTETRIYRFPELYPEAFEAYGYRRYNASIEEFSNGFWQKRFVNERGIKYHIEFYEYDYAQFRNHPTKDVSYEPKAQFHKENDVVFNVAYLPNAQDTIESIEKFFESVFVQMNCTYYEEYNR
jgi:hypothetical protein